MVSTQSMAAAVAILKLIHLNLSKMSPVFFPGWEASTKPSPAPHYPPPWLSPATSPSPTRSPAWPHPPATCLPLPSSLAAVPAAHAWQSGLISDSLSCTCGSLHTTPTALQPDRHSKLLGKGWALVGNSFLYRVQ
jgi:hypothetical protein